MTSGSLGPGAPRGLVQQTCSYFQTSIESRPAPGAQHDHAAAHDQTGRQELFARLIRQIDDNQTS